MTRECCYPPDLPLQVVGVHCISTGRWVRDLPVGQVAAHHSLPTTTGILVAGSTEVIAAAVVANRVTAVWRREGSMEMAHQGCHPGKGVMVAIAVTGSRVVTLAQDGTLVILENLGTKWGAVQLLKHPLDPLHMEQPKMWLGACGEWTVASCQDRQNHMGLNDRNPSEVAVWCGDQKIKSLNTPKHEVTSLSLAPPHVFISFNNQLRSSALQVYHLETSQLVRSLEIPGVSLGLFASNNHIAHLLKVIETVVHQSASATKLGEILIVMDKAELVNSSVANEKIWQRKVETEKWSFGILASLNTTSLVMARTKLDRRVLSVLDFWMQRGKCEEQVAREEEQEERERREANEVARLAELKRTRPSYVSQDKGKRGRKGKKGGSGGWYS